METKKFRFDSFATEFDDCKTDEKMADNDNDSGIGESIFRQFFLSTLCVIVIVPIG